MNYLINKKNIFENEVSNKANLIFDKYCKINNS